MKLLLLLILIPFLFIVWVQIDLWATDGDKKVAQASWLVFSILTLSTTMYGDSESVRAIGTGVSIVAFFAVLLWVYDKVKKSTTSLIKEDSDEFSATNSDITTIQEYLEKKSEIQKQILRPYKITEINNKYKKTIPEIDMPKYTFSELVSEDLAVEKKPLLVILDLPLALVQEQRLKKKKPKMNESNFSSPKKTCPFRRDSINKQTNICDGCGTGFSISPI